MSKDNPTRSRKKIYVGKRFRGLQGTGKKMLPKPKPKPMTIKELKRELKQKKQRRRGPRIRGRKAVT